MALRAVRHAPTAYNHGRVFMGGLDIDPTPDGLAAAAALAPGLRADHVIASPSSRATRTAAALFPGRTVRCDDRLRERGMGVWEARRKDDVRREHPGCFPGGHLDVTVTPPGGEPLDALLARVASFLADVAGLARTREVVVVSHNGWIRAAQYLLGETTLPRFHAHPTPPLVPVVLDVPPAGGSYRAGPAARDTVAVWVAPAGSSHSTDTRSPT